MKEKNEEYEALKKKALEQFKRDEPLLGKDGAFAPLLKEFLESALDAEVEEHLDEGERNRGNLRNGGEYAQRCQLIPRQRGVSS